jgi:hypothetical protein
VRAGEEKASRPLFSRPHETPATQAKHGGVLLKSVMSAQIIGKSKAPKKRDSSVNIGRS